MTSFVFEEFPANFKGYGTLLLTTSEFANNTQIGIKQ